MAEAAAATNFQVFTKGDRKVVDFYQKSDIFSTIYSQSIRGWRERATKRYNRLVQFSYPNKVSYLVTYGLSIYALQKFFPDNTVSKLITEQQGWFTGIVEGVFTTFKTLLPNSIFSILKTTLSKLIDQNTSERFTFILVSWFGYALITRHLYKTLLTYTNFVYENKRSGFSTKTKIWSILLKLMHGNPKLYSAQNCLPHLPLPTVEETCTRWLNSIRPIVDDTEYAECVQLAREFQNGLGPKCQKYLYLKRLCSSNWVTDWWEQYVYLKSRSPIMVKSNYYTICHGNGPESRMTSNALAVAGNYVHILFKWRYQLEKEDVKIQCIGEVRPVCMNQFERLFNTTRIPFEDCDKLIHYKQSNHIIVYSDKKYFKVKCYSSGRLLTPAELQDQFQIIANDTSSPKTGEEYLAALTAGSRDKWYNAREEHFTDKVNRASLRDIETATFVVSLIPEEYDCSIKTADEGSEWSKVAKSAIHGTCSNIWFDKSFNLLIFKNGVTAFNGEHAFADAPVIGYTMEECMLKDQILGYDADGNARGERFEDSKTIAPTRLRWQLTSKAVEDIMISYREAKLIADDVEIYACPFLTFGKKRITREFKCSPDAFIQLSLQVAHLADMGKSVLTYESAMTRLWREGRTETVRSATPEAVNFAKLILDDNAERSDVLAAFKAGESRHRNMNLDAMTGKGIDRHLFGLYIICSYLKLESTFLNKVFGMTWGLSTSQTPSNQHSELGKYKNYKPANCPGGGFGPVDPNGYGCSYLIMGDNIVNFHISSLKSCDKTNSERFCKNIFKAMNLIAELLEKK